jgi:hypothetical protein
MAKRTVDWTAMRGSEAETPTAEGLRERKKRLMRQLLTDTATVLISLWTIQFRMMGKHLTGTPTAAQLREALTAEVQRAARLLENGLGTFAFGDRDGRQPSRSGEAAVAQLGEAAVAQQELAVDPPAFG